MSSICDGTGSCSWDNSIADDVKDPCPDVFKYMSVDYECGVPAPARSMGGDCEEMMMQAFYNVNTAVGSSWMNSRGLHKSNFYANHFYNDEQFSGRLSKFEHNMRRWGKRFDSFSCVCPTATTLQMPAINSLNEVEGFLAYMSEAGSAMFCGKEHHMDRKMKHAKQILRMK
jgi:hypothetical protein